jgi:hypothetical protein
MRPGGVLVLDFFFRKRNTEVGAVEGDCFRVEMSFRSVRRECRERARHDVEGTRVKN